MMLEVEYKQRQENESKAFIELFYDRLEVDQDLAQALVDIGLTSIE